MRHHRAWVVVAYLILLGSVLALAVQGCGPNGQVQYLCPDPKFGTYDPRCDQCQNLTLPGCCDGYYDIYDHYIPPKVGCPLDGGTDGGDASVSITPEAGAGDAKMASTCDGQCVAAPPFGWDGPGLLWLGSGTAPSCPSNAPVTANLWHTDLVVPPASCTACTCSLSSGSCALPSLFTTSTEPCIDDALPMRRFDAPPGWDGSCTNVDAIAAGDLCDGVPCAGSLTAAPLIVTENGCAPSTATLVNPTPASWKTAALGCVGTTSPAITCDNPGLTCAPNAAQAPGFLTCIFQNGDGACPSSYPDKHLVYDSFTDDRGCAPCACGAPDSSCSAILDVYLDDVCTPPKPIFALYLTSAGPACGDVMPIGSALGSKRVTGLAYQPAACAPGGGELTGAVAPSGPSTFCCLAGAATT